MRQALAIFIITAALSPLTCAQSIPASRVPAAVKETLHQKFPSIKVVEWKFKSDNNYEAEFTLNRTELAVKFDSAGKWLETESSVAQSEIPAAIRDSAMKRFNAYKVIETQTVQRWDQAQVVYELHLENATEVVKIQFAADGKILNQSAKPKSNQNKINKLELDGSRAFSYPLYR
jgi:hypothetical protein